MPVTKGFYYITYISTLPSPFFSCNPAIHPSCLSPLFFSAPEHSFLEHSSPRGELWTLNSPQIQANFYSVLFCVFIHRQLLPSLPLPPTHNCPLWPHYHYVFPPGKQPHWILGGRHWPDFNTNAPVENGTNLGEEQRRSGFKAETPVSAQKGFHTTPVNNNNHLRGRKDPDYKEMPSKQPSVLPFFFWHV